MAAAGLERMALADATEVTAACVACNDRGLTMVVRVKGEGTAADVIEIVKLIVAAAPVQVISVATLPRDLENDREIDARIDFVSEPRTKDTDTDVDSDKAQDRDGARDAVVVRGGVMVFGSVIVGEIVVDKW